MELFDDVIVDDGKEPINDDPNKLNPDNVNDLTPELQTELFTKFGTKYNGTSVDVKGNLVDKDGKVIKTFEELSSEVEDEETTIELEGIKYKLDDKGNAIDEQGKVVKTKEEVDDLKKPLPTLLSERTGNILKDEKGNVLIFSDDINGLIERETKLVEIAANNAMTTAVKDYFTSNPELISAHNYYVKNGTLKGFTNTDVDYSKVELDKDNIDLHIDYIVKAELEKGNTEERAKVIANYFKQDNKTFEEAQNAIKFLKETNDNRNKAAMEATQAKINADRQVELNLQNNLKTLLKSKKVGDITLPDTFKVKRGDKELTLTHDDLIKEMFVPKYKNKDGETFTEIEKIMLDIQGDPQKLLMFNLQLLTGMNLNQLVKTNVEQAKVDTLFKRLQTYKSTTKSKTPIVKTFGVGNDIIIDQ